MKNFKFNINGTDYSVDIVSAEGQELKMKVNGTEYNVTLPQPEKKEAPVSRPISRVSTPAQGEVQRSNKPTGNNITAPLPGTILDVFVNVGDKVKMGQSVVLLEAMKMENHLESDCDGTVKEVRVRKGDSVLEGAVLIVVE